MTTGLAHGRLQKPICLGVQGVSGDQQKEDHRQQFVLAQSVADLFRLYQGAQANEQAAGKECLTLPRSAVDYDNCLITVTGKGSKVRIVPMSLTCRAVLFRWSQTHQHPLLFCTASGGKLSVHNLRRDLLLLLRKCGVQKPAGSFHTWRRLSAKLFVRSGGDVATLSRILGHSKVSVTMDHYLDGGDSVLRSLRFIGE